jgi:arsenate reductase (thioredoxin)
MLWRLQPGSAMSRVNRNPPFLRGARRIEEEFVKEKVKILFVCVQNASRSQMAQGFAEAFGKGKVEAYSAGSKPSSHINPLVVEAMKEKGIDLSGRRPKGLNDLPSIEMDYLVTMGCEETCPAISAKRIIEWQIPDPKGKPIDEVRRIRDMLEAKVKTLLDEIES